MMRSKTAVPLNRLTIIKMLEIISPHYHKAPCLQQTTPQPATSPQSPRITIGRDKCGQKFIFSRLTKQMQLTQQLIDIPRDIQSNLAHQMRNN